MSFDPLNPSRPSAAQPTSPSPLGDNTPAAPASAPDPLAAEPEPGRGARLAQVIGAMMVAASAKNPSLAGQAAIAQINAHQNERKRRNLRREELKSGQAEAEKDRAFTSTRDSLGRQHDLKVKKVEQDFQLNLAEDSRRHAKALADNEVALGLYGILSREKVALTEEGGRSRRADADRAAALQRQVTQLKANFTAMQAEAGVVDMNSYNSTLQMIDQLAAGEEVGEGLMGGIQAYAEEKARAAEQSRAFDMLGFLSNDDLWEGTPHPRTGNRQRTIPYVDRLKAASMFANPEHRPTEEAMGFAAQLDTRRAMGQGADGVEGVMMLGESVNEVVRNNPNSDFVKSSGVVKMYSNAVVMPILEGTASSEEALAMVKNDIGEEAYQTLLPFLELAATEAISERARLLVQKEKGLNEVEVPLLPGNPPSSFGNLLNR